MGYRAMRCSAERGQPGKKCRRHGDDTHPESLGGEKTHTFSLQKRRPSLRDGVNDTKRLEVSSNV
jgi:hypothetical protein